MPEFIFQMQDLRKVVPPKREILKGIWLAFFYGAKIGVLGHNGAGKSSLLRIMAGAGQGVLGRGVPREGDQGRLPAAGAAARRLEDRPRQRRGGRGRDQGPARALQRHQREVLRADGAGGDGEAPRGAGQGAGQDRGGERLGAGPHARDGDGRAALPAGRSGASRRSPAASGAASRSAGSCCRSPTCCCSTSRPTTSTPSRSPGWSASSRNTPARSWR